MILKCRVRLQTFTLCWQIVQRCGVGLVRGQYGCVCEFTINPPSSFWLHTHGCTPSQWHVSIARAYPTVAAFRGVRALTSNASSTIAHELIAHV